MCVWGACLYTKDVFNILTCRYQIVPFCDIFFEANH